MLYIFLKHKNHIPPNAAYLLQIVYYHWVNHILSEVRCLSNIKEVIIGLGHVVKSIDSVCYKHIFKLYRYSQKKSSFFTTQCLIMIASDSKESLHFGPSRDYISVMLVTWSSSLHKIFSYLFIWSPNIFPLYTETVRICSIFNLVKLRPSTKETIFLPPNSLHKIFSCLFICAPNIFFLYTEVVRICQFSTWWNWAFQQKTCIFLPPNSSRSVYVCSVPVYFELYYMWMIQESIFYVKWSFQRLNCKCEWLSWVAELNFLNCGGECIIPNILLPMTYTVICSYIFAW